MFHLYRKSFPSKNAFVSHLRSAHGGNDISCPTCGNHFGSLHALAAHVESQSRKCHMRESKAYGWFLNQLTWGTAEVAGRHGDYTLKYQLQKGFQEDFGPHKSTGPTYGHQQVHGSQGTDGGAAPAKQQQLTAGALEKQQKLTAGALEQQRKLTAARQEQQQKPTVARLAPQQQLTAGALEQQQRAIYGSGEQSKPTGQQKQQGSDASAGGSDFAQPDELSRCLLRLRATNQGGSGPRFQTSYGVSRADSWAASPEPSAVQQQPSSFWSEDSEPQKKQEQGEGARGQPRSSAKKQQGGHGALPSGSDWW